MQTSEKAARRVPVKQKKRRVADRVDNLALEVALQSSSLLIWVFYSAAALYVAYCNAFVTAPSSSSSFSSSSPSFPVTVATQHSRLYYYLFPADFDLATYIPLLTRVLCFSAVAIGSTYAIANRYGGGSEALMVVAWCLGALSERFWLTTAVASGTAAVANPSPSIAGVTSSSGQSGSLLTDGHVPVVPSWLWLVVSVSTGFFSGVLCKVKDVAEGKLDRGHHLLSFFADDDDAGVAARGDEEHIRRAGGSSVLEGAAPAGVGTYHHRRHRTRSGGVAASSIGLGERLYMVVPFCTGQWLAFILRHGWRGIIVENSIIVLSLGMVGYTMLSFKVLREQVYRVSGRTTVVRYRRTVPAAAGGDDEEGTVIEEEEVATSVDLIDLISKIFTTSFGGVALAVVGLNVFITTMAIPFLKALFKLNALVSSVGILVELIVYEMA